MFSPLPRTSEGGCAAKGGGGEALDKIRPLHPLHHLERLQTRPGDPHFAPGLFPADRTHPTLPYRRWDDNVFYPALIDLTLTPLLDRMTPDERKRTERLLAAIRANYPAYESVRCPGLYNFYRTRPPAPYPNGRLLRRIRHFRLPADADDTVLVSNNLPDVDPATVAYVREQLVRFSNLAGKKVRHPLPGYGDIPAHGVWFGSGAMPVEIDLCVLCNILYFTARRGAAFNATDRASFDFLARALATGDLFDHPFALSHYYPDPTVILYHYGRLWSALDEPDRWFDRSALLAAVVRRWEQDERPLPRLLLATTTLKLGATPPPLTISPPALSASFATFPFFVAPMLAGTHRPWFRRLAARRVFQLYYRCEAYYWVLVWEYGLLRGEGEKVRILEN